jgi:hypothetical protein
MTHWRPWIGRVLFVLAAFVAGALIVVALSPPVHAQGNISIAIEKHAALTKQGAIVITVRIACGPLPGVEEFQEAIASAAQEKTGAEAEGGLDGTVVCDGVDRTHTAHLSSFTDAGFKRGPASASASLLVCTLVGDEQMCFQGAMHRRVIVRGALVP